MRKIFKNENAITLVALVVTIIVLIILAGTSMSLVLGNNGILTKASEANRAQPKAEIIEKVKLEIAAKEAEKLTNTNGISQSEIEKILKKYGTININENETIKSLTPEGKDYEIPFEEIYDGNLVVGIESEPEKSEKVAFSRSNGVIEIKFLEGTSYKITNTPNPPKMGANMKKVYWEEDGTEIIEGQEGFDETKWYSYIAQEGDTEEGGTSKWANAVTVDNEGNITGYFVWIPRYAYRIVYFDTKTNKNNYRENGTATGIVGYSDARGFVDTEGKTPSDMESPVTSIAVGINKLRPHPAFENGTLTGFTQGEWNTELEGIWVAKYDTSGSLIDMKALPGVSALVSQTIGDMYTNSLKFSIENKSHMLKNSEWGAMAYLTESKYGRNGTAVTINSEGTYTAGAEGATVTSNPLQSTTGNYYGVYDSVGTVEEFAAGYIATNSINKGNSFASTDNTYNNKTESTEYATVYNMATSDSINENYSQNINKKFGDAIVETTTGSYHFMGLYMGSPLPFLVRGIFHSMGNGWTPLLKFEFSGGLANYCGSRLCLVVK